MPEATNASPPDALRRVERIATLLDEAFSIPGTRIKVGLDSLIGLVPVVGDVAGVALGSWFIYEAHRLGAPAELKWKMARNVGIDAVAGLVPVLGDVVDVAFRSNRRNLNLLRAHFRPSEPLQAAARPWRAAVVIASILGALWLGYWLMKH